MASRASRRRLRARPHRLSTAVLVLGLLLTLPASWWTGVPGPAAAPATEEAVTAPAAASAAEEPASAPAEAPVVPLDCPEEKALCVQAERSGGIDLKTGVARLEGNVRGFIRARGLSFAAERLTAFREGGQEWVRLVLEGDVRLVQDDREAAGDNSVLERNTVRLTGHVRIARPDLHITGHEAVIESDVGRTVVRGQPDAPLVATLHQSLLATTPAAQGTPAPPPPPEAGGPAPAPNGEPAADGKSATEAPGEGEPGAVTSRLSAQSMVMEGEPPRVVLTGDVHIEQSDGGLRMEARQVTLRFAEDRTLESFDAEGNVVIHQPDRRISADFAQSRNRLETILLVGNARMQEAGQFDVASERMEVYADSGKGILQSQDRRKPITLSLELAGDQPYGLTGPAMLTLSQRGVAPRTLEKLAPLIGKKFPSRAAFRKAVAPLLERKEAERYLDTILAVAPLGAR